MNMNQCQENGLEAKYVQAFGWPGLELGNGTICAVIIPAIGGRIMSFTFDGFDYIWRNQALEGQLFSAAENQGDGTLAAWKNYGGGKTWPAPQGWRSDDEWAGPPDPVLDTGHYAVDRLLVDPTQSMARIRSPSDLRTGTQITREFILYPHGTHACLHLEMRNISNRVRAWSLWDVVQIDGSRQRKDGSRGHNDRVWMYVPLNAHSCFPGGYSVLFGAAANPEWQPDYETGIMAVQYQYVVGKIGIDSPDGWVAVTAGEGDRVLCQRFSYCAGERYPDGGTSVACWTTGLGEPVGNLDYVTHPLYHLECEVLGPLRTMQPGEAQSLDIDWYATRCPGPIRRVTAVGCCSQSLKVIPDGSAVQLSGVYGVFHTGSLQLRWLDTDAASVAQQRLTDVDPRHPVQLDHPSEPPKKAGVAILELLDRDGQLLGELDRLTL